MALRVVRDQYGYDSMPRFIQEAMLKRHAEADWHQHTPHDSVGVEKEMEADRQDADRERSLAPFPPSSLRFFYAGITSGCQHQSQSTGRLSRRHPSFHHRLMSAFTDEELAYLDDQRLGRLATVGGNSQPHVVPVGFRYDAESDTIQIGGRNMAESKKFRDARRNPRVAFVVDDLQSVDPWRVRGIEIRGEVEAFTDGGTQFGPGYGDAWVQITPTRIVSWGINEDDGGAVSRRSV